MKKRIIICTSVFAVINIVICALSNEYSYLSVSALFNFCNSDGFPNLTLMIFNVSFVALSMVTINSLVEEKMQIGKYIQVRSKRKHAVYLHISRLIKETSLIAFSKIILDFIFYLVFDRANFKYFLFNSILLYITFLLWLILFDFLSELATKNNILILFFVSAISISYLLLRYSNLFLLPIIKTYESNTLLLKAVLLKTIFLISALTADVIVKLKKDWY